MIGRVLSIEGRGEASPQTSQLPPPKKKSFTERKNLQLFQIKIFFDDDFKESVKVTMSRNAISANPEHYIFKIFRGEHAGWLKNFFQDRLPPKTKNPR